MIVFLQDVHSSPPAVDADAAPAVDDDTAGTQQIDVAELH